jgi:EH domain-containing protein 1
MFFIFILNCIACNVTDVKMEMMKSKLPNSVLGKIYGLADVDQDGLLDADEFALMMYLISIKLDGHDLPSELPPHLIPPLKRQGVQQTASISEKTS